MRRSLALLLAAALLWQGILAQAHMHAEAFAAVAAGDAAGAADPSWRGDGGVPGDIPAIPGIPHDSLCPICQILHAHGGVVLPQVLPFAAAPSGVVVAPPARAPPCVAVRFSLPPSHAPPAAS